MGSSSSSSSLPDYMSNYFLDCFLIRSCIAFYFRLLKRFSLMVPEDSKMDVSYRFPMDLVSEVFPQLKYNPFKDRIFKVFSSLKDDHFSFEDMLDLCSVMSDNCPDQVKAKWAFQIFDFNEDGSVDAHDIKNVMDRLTQGVDEPRALDELEKIHIIEILLKAMDIQGIGSLNRLEFEHAIGKMSEFPSSFSFRI